MTQSSSGQKAAQKFRNQRVFRHVNKVIHGCLSQTDEEEGSVLFNKAVSC